MAELSSGQIRSASNQKHSIHICDVEPWSGLRPFSPGGQHEALNSPGPQSGTTIDSGLHIELIVMLLASCQMQRRCSTLPQILNCRQQ